MLVILNKTVITKVWQQKMRTDLEGQLVLTLNQEGQWMVSLVHMIPLANYAEGNCQSYLGNLTFEF